GMHLLLRLQNGAGDFFRQLAAADVQFRARSFDFRADASFGLLNLLVGALARLLDGGAALIERHAPRRFLLPEEFPSSFAQRILVGAAFFLSALAQLFGLASSPFDTPAALLDNTLDRT